MKTSSLALVVAPRTGKIIKNVLDVFGNGEKSATKRYIKLCIWVKPIVRNRVGKLEFSKKGA